MEIKYEPIAFFKSSHTQTYEAPRQGVLAEESYGEIKFIKSIIHDSFKDLEGFDKIWVIYDFHQNNTWKPKVRPPRFSDQKKSVLSTRSPYRPNSIGISCVNLVKVEVDKLVVSGHDILEGSPILDVKPYLPYSDSFVDAATGWVKQDVKPYNISFDDEVILKVNWLSDKTNIDFRQVITNQLSYEPTNSKSKRVKLMDNNQYEFSIRTWRIVFRISENDSINIDNIKSGYSVEELSSKSDPHEDKLIHKEFIKTFL